MFLVRRKRAASDTIVGASDVADVSTEQPSSSSSLSKLIVVVTLFRSSTSSDDTEVTVLPTEFPDFSASEEGPLAEVNVFLAYGYFDQAEEFVRDAIAGDPNRVNFHDKLLEVFYVSGNKTAYEEETRVLNELVNGEWSHWDMTLAVWSEMSPNRALFEAPPVEIESGGMLDLTADEVVKSEVTYMEMDFDDDDEDHAVFVPHASDTGRQSGRG